MGEVITSQEINRIMAGKENGDEAVEKLRDFLRGKEPPTYPQDQEDNEFRYLSPAWLNELAKGLTAGAVKHPGETWRTIPAREHVWRAVRHCVMWLMGDRSEPHLVNAGMRVMMAWETEQKEE